MTTPSPTAAMTTAALVDPATLTLPGNSLRAATPAEGLHLALQVARAARHASGEADPKPAAAEMADYLRQPAAATLPAPGAQLIVSSFAIVAAANNYWL